MMRSGRWLVLHVLAVILASGWAEAAEGRWEAGSRILLVNGGGDPAHDTMSLGAFGRFRFAGSWRLGFGLDQRMFDFERPEEIIGLKQDPDLAEVVDADASATILGAWVERTHGQPDRRLGWFWGPGLALAFVSADDARGTVPGGQQYDLSTDAGTELLATFDAGMSVRLTRRSRLELAARLEQHFADWKVEDRISGRTGTVDDYTLYGARLGLAWSF